MPTTTNTPVVAIEGNDTTTEVNVRAWNAYALHTGRTGEDAMTVAAAGEALGYSGGGGGAAIKKVKDAVDAGHTIVLRPDPSTEPIGLGDDAPATVTVDRYAMADAHVSGMGAIVLMLDNQRASADPIRAKARKLREEADRLDADASRRYDDIVSNVAPIMTGAGFDLNAFEEEYATAIEEANTDTEEDTDNTEA